MYGEARIRTIREKVHICVEGRVTNLGFSVPEGVALNRWLAWHGTRVCKKIPCRRAMPHANGSKIPDLMRQMAR